MNIDKKIEKFFNQRIFLHVGFWVTTLSFALFGEVNGDKSTVHWNGIMHLSIHFVGFIAATYINLYALIPRFLMNRKYMNYSFWVLLICILSTLTTQYLQIVIGNLIFNINVEEDLVFLFFHITFYCILIIMLTTMFYFFRRRMNMQELSIKLREAEKQQVVSELKALKTQINPHFFFNVLNSIYALSIENDSKTPDVILKLSSLMRYVIYDTCLEKVSLKKELDFIQNYIELEKTRLEDSVEIDINIDGDDFNQTKIAPLIFISFIENAFKHCGKAGPETPSITISYDLTKLPELTMKVENTIDVSDVKVKDRKGVGIENAKQRLQLLYPEKYSLAVEKKEHAFQVTLKMNLSQK